MTFEERLAEEYNGLVAGGMNRDEAAELVDGVMELELQGRRNHRNNAPTGQKAASAPVNETDAPAIRTDMTVRNA